MQQKKKQNGLYKHKPVRKPKSRQKCIVGQKMFVCLFVCFFFFFCNFWTVWFIIPPRESQPRMAWGTHASQTRFQLNTFLSQIAHKCSLVLTPLASKCASSMFVVVSSSGTHTHTPKGLVWNLGRWQRAAVAAHTDAAVAAAAAALNVVLSTW